MLRHRQRSYTSWLFFANRYSLALLILAHIAILNARTQTVRLQLSGGTIQANQRTGVGPILRSVMLYPR